METGLIGPAIAIVVFAVGAVGGYFTYKAKIDFLLGLVKEQRADHEAAARRTGELEAKAFALELRIEREFVKKDDLVAVESRLGKRLDSVEHAVKNTATQILAAVSTMSAGAPRRRAPE